MTLTSEDADLELRDAVLQVLEETGALNKIRVSPLRFRDACTSCTPIYCLSIANLNI